MSKLIDPLEFGISGKTIIEEVGNGEFTIIVDRKSRVIMSDGRRLLEKALKIKDRVIDAKISVSTSAPVCSKTIKFLDENGITVKEK